MTDVNIDKQENNGIVLMRIRRRENKYGCSITEKNYFNFKYSL